jgi:alkyl sulfatase BDS1-like metallo-beta-lactamase superfamily hydrolase
MIRALAGVALSTLIVAQAAFAQEAPKPASAATIAAQKAAKAALPKEDGKDLEFARRGFIATSKEPVIVSAKGEPLWNFHAYDFLKGDAPATVHPALWRHQSLLKENGLFKASEGVWQVRGFDISNMTLIAGKTGWIIVDPLTRTDVAKAALGLANEKLGARPVAAVIYTHSHSDHFGGVKGIVSAEDVKAGKVQIIAPEHFVEEAASENVIAGPAMGRRATYQFGVGTPPGVQGSMGSGIGSGLSGGEISMIPPTLIIRKTGETHVVDGVTLEFQMVPETEAPAELNVMLPERRTFLVGEIAVCSQHNVLTPRGALVRNTLRWAGFLSEALRLYADRSDTLVASHCWPRFGNGEVKSFLTAQRDNYKFLHDQSVRLMNNGLNATELAEQIVPTPELAANWSTHGYYGTYNHNAKAVSQRYIGWYDANPANLNPHIPTERAKRLVAALGGADRVLALGKAAMAQGDYRWSSDLLSQLVFAEPGNTAAKALLADSFEQQGYQAESALWRNMFLTGASELRHDAVKLNTAVSLDLAAAIPSGMLLDSVATRLVPAKVADVKSLINLEFTDRNEKAAITLQSGVMVAEMDQSHAAPMATLKGPRQLFLGLMFMKAPLAMLEKAGLTVEGERAVVEAWQAAIETPEATFNIVTP